MAFFQPPPSLGNQFDEDRVLRSYLARVLPDDARHDIAPALSELGALAAGELYQLQAADRLNEPVLTPWDPWGNRVDHIEVTALWKRAAVIAAEYGLVAVAYERRHGALSRIDQFARVHLFNPSTDVYSCPLAMTDGAARTLSLHNNSNITGRALPHLTSRDPAQMWTSGQWMTERTGGSDVGLTETVARRDDDGTWRLHGTKWFSSATTSQMALTLARPEGNPPGGRGLALFYVETHDAAGKLQRIGVNRLKDKLGTRKVPTAELTLDGTPALPVTGLTEGIRAISPMLNITRTWNAVCASSLMRRSVALARDYARRRRAFGAALADKPLHLDTLAGLQAESEAAFHLTFRAVEMLGRDEAGEATEEDASLLRLITPLVKLTTGRQAVQVTSEAIECFGGAGYVEDTGLPTLLRDAQVLPIWEGTTNVLSLDALKAMGQTAAVTALRAEVAGLAASVRDPALVEVSRVAVKSVDRALETARGHIASAASGIEGLARLEADARRIALTLGRSLALALLARHADWSLAHENDPRARAAALRFARNGVDLLGASPDLDDARMLAMDEA